MPLGDIKRSLCREEDANACVAQLVRLVRSVRKIISKPIKHSFLKIK